MTQTQLDALMAKAGLLMYRIQWTQKELDTLTERRARYEKQLHDVSELIKAAQTAAVAASKS
jgi:hypothetical protein